MRETETEHVGGGAEREGDTESQNLKQAPGSELSAQSPTGVSNSRTVRSRPELKSDIQPTKPPKRLKIAFLFMNLQVKDNVYMLSTHANHTLQ